MLRRRGVMTGVLLNGGAPAVFTISGIVYDADGTTAVASATVALGALTATSAANGTYTISNVPPGTSGSMTCTKTGYIWPAITVAAMAGSLTSQNYTNKWYAAAGSAADCIIAYQPKGAASLAASYVNLINPGTMNANPYSAPTLGASGWVLNGGKYLGTGLSPNAAGYSYLIQFSNATGVGAALIGCYTVSGTRVRLLPDNGAAGIVYSNGGGATTVATAMTAGNMGMAATKAYRNGSVDATGMANNAVNIELLIGAMNANGSANSTFTTCNIQAFVAYSGTKSDAQMLAIATAMSSL